MPLRTPTDSRQREIMRLLGLIGGEPAAYFADACRLMDGDATLEATTHVVGHLLRELDGSLAGVMRPMVPVDRWPESGTDHAQRRKVDAVCDALRVPREDDLRENWYAYASSLHRQAHRHGLAAPRRVDAEFRELWEQGQAVVYALARRIEANFTATLPLIDELAAGQPRMRVLREQVPHSTVALDRFFERATPAWLGPLRDAGYFADPPPLVHGEDGAVSYPRWPQGRYLARVAADQPEAVIDLGVDLETDNPEAHEAFVDAASVAPVAQGARLVPTVERWLETPAQWALPLKVPDLITHLVAGGEVDTGLRLLRALGLSTRAGRDRHLAGELIDQLQPRIFPAAGLDGVDVLADLLHEQVEEEAYGEHDHSSIWRPLLEGGRRQDLRDVLVTAVRDAAEAVVAGGAASVGEVVAALEQRQFSIFRRLALDLLARYPNFELIADRLTDEGLFDDGAYSREYAALARQHFRNLAPEAQATILGWVEAAPRYIEDEEGRRRWQRRVLERFGRPLPGEWEARFEALADVEAAPESDPEFGFIGPRSPLGDAELAEMCVDDVVARLRDWEPEGGDWRGPSPEGLARALERVVAADPDRFALGAGAFADLDATYVRALVGGLRRANADGIVFAWPIVLDLIWEIRTKPREIEGRDPRGFELDPGWTWAWQESLHLIDAGLLGGPGQIPREERDRVWRVITHYAEDPNPTVGNSPEDDLGPATRALNSIRGMAVHAAFRYGWWLRGDVNDPERRLPPELAELLGRRLDLVLEPTAAVRSVYGQFFAALVACDERFAAEHVEAIFPADDERLWRAAWRTYLRADHAYVSTFRLLPDQYRRGVDELEASDGDDLLGDTGQALIAHLMTLFAIGEIELDGDLLGRFYEIAGVERRAQAIEAIGHGLKRGELPEDVAARFKRLFEARLEYVRASGDAEELRGFAWWFASGEFDADWSLAKLRELLAVGARIHPDHLVAERLAEIRRDHLAEAIALIELMIETGTRQWFVIGAREHITAIVADALAAGGQIESRARDVVNRLVARGHRDFEALLPD
jgi:hypothetical protein